MMFLVFGLVTAAWIVPWLMVLRRLRPDHATGGPVRPGAQGRSAFRLMGDGIGHIANTYGFYFLLAWLPLFLVKQRGFSIEQMSYYATLSYVANAIAALLFGWASDRWSASGRSEPAIRRAMLVVAQLLFAGCVVGIYVTGAHGWLALWLILAGVANGAGGAQHVCARADVRRAARGGNLGRGPERRRQPVRIDRADRYRPDDRLERKLCRGFWLAAGVTAFGAIWWAFVLPKIRLLDFD